MSATFLTAEWNNLIMANYITDPAILKKYVPDKTELDVYNGNVYVSLIGFMFQKTKILGVKIPFHVNFEEVNLRFYVRYNDNGQWKRGAVFIKEIVPKPAISIIANTLYHEKYSTMRMKHFFKQTADTINLGYHWKHKGKWNKLEATTATEPLPMQPGSEEEFIAEHYWGYSQYNTATTFEYNVQHPAWKVYPVKQYIIDCDFKTLYGDEFAFLQNTVPNSVFMAQGSAIAILKKRRL
ncbi:YqjF family protein [Ferruginibacter sp. SUN106]|uniref:YqjF family protein n=1 Tax=Ferruginibacter sp. SUN106 TaxID=2978348 RepID=UPI003D35EF6E